MKIYHQPVELIIQSPAVTAKAIGPDPLAKQLANAGIPVEEIVNRSATLPQTSLAKLAGKSAPALSSEKKLYVKTAIKDSEVNPWDLAHEAAKVLKNGFVEPDFLQEFTTDNNIDISHKKGISAKGKKSADEGYDPDWQPQQNIIWHLDDAHSQLLSARNAVMNIDYTVRIGHLDTGYNQTHAVLPPSARSNVLQRSFVEGEDETDAHDRYTGGLGRMPGHGTGTLGLLAGGKIKLNTDNGLFNDYLGGAPFAEIICCRVSPSVILMKTSAFAEALNYLTALSQSGTQVHVVSMSMGGAPSRSWADAVNAAYDAGITIVTAAGNNFNGLPTRHMVYPARFERVIGACGITNDYKPYQHAKLGEMQGCCGPKRHMNKALSAFTPNTPWCKGDANTISFGGAGTSSATPQIAAAAAIYYRKYHAQLDALLPWQRVEAIRYALYKSASQKGKAPGNYQEYFGNGYLQAAAALQVPVNSKLSKADEDRNPWFPILSTLIKAKPGTQKGGRLEMLNTELAQLVYSYPELSALIQHEATPFEKISAKKWKAFAEAVIQHPAASIALRKHLMNTAQ